MAGTVKVQGYRPSFGTAVNGFGQTDAGESYPAEVVAAGDAGASDVAAAEEAAENGGTTPMLAPAETPPNAGGVVTPTEKQSVSMASHKAAIAKLQRRFWWAVGIGTAATIAAGVGGFYLGKRSVKKSLGMLGDWADPGLGGEGPAFQGPPMGDAE